MYKRYKYFTAGSILLILVLTLSTTTVFAKNLKDTNLEAFFDNIMNSKNVMSLKNLFVANMLDI